MDRIRITAALLLLILFLRIRPSIVAAVSTIVKLITNTATAKPGSVGVSTRVVVLRFVLLLSVIALAAATKNIVFSFFVVVQAAVVVRHLNKL